MLNGKLEKNVDSAKRLWDAGTDKKKKKKKKNESSANKNEQKYRESFCPFSRGFDDKRQTIITTNNSPRAFRIETVTG